MYSVFVRIVNGDYVFVASREHREQAAQLVHELRACWPEEYVIREGRADAPVSVSTAHGEGTHDQGCSNETAPLCSKPHG